MWATVVKEALTLSRCKRNIVTLQADFKAVWQNHRLCLQAFANPRGTRGVTNATRPSRQCSFRRLNSRPTPPDFAALEFHRELARAARADVGDLVSTNAPPIVFCRPRSPRYFPYPSDKIRESNPMQKAMLAHARST